MMKLRWFATCDKNGVKTEPILQYWDIDNKYWEPIPYVECKVWDEDTYLLDEMADNSYYFNRKEK